MFPELKKRAVQGKNKVLGVPPISAVVQEALNSDEGTGPTKKQLIEITQASYLYYSFSIIMHKIWKRVSDPSKNHIRTYKALVLLEYLLLHGSHAVVKDALANKHHIEHLLNFKVGYHTGGIFGREISLEGGHSIRERSHAIMEYFNDSEKLKMERRKLSLRRRKQSAAKGKKRNNNHNHNHNHNNNNKKQNQSEVIRRKEAMKMANDNKQRNSRNSFSVSVSPPKWSVSTDNVIKNSMGSLTRRNGRKRTVSEGPKRRNCTVKKIEKEEKKKKKKKKRKKKNVLW